MTASPEQPLPCFKDTCFIKARIGMKDRTRSLRSTDCEARAQKCQHCPVSSRAERLLKCVDQSVICELCYHARGADFGRTSCCQAYVDLSCQGERDLVWGCRRHGLYCKAHNTPGMTQDSSAPLHISNTERACPDCFTSWVSDRLGPHTKPGSLASLAAKAVSSIPAGFTSAQQQRVVTTLGRAYLR